MKQHLILENVTAVIKTFERPKSLDRLIHSIRRFYPDLRITVADDSLKPKVRNDVNYITLPHDGGVSVGRNSLVMSVQTPYFLLLEDDFEFTAETQVEKLAYILEEHDVQLAAGDCVNKRKRLFRQQINREHFHGLLTIDGKHLTLNRGYHHQIDNFYLCDMVSNFYVGRVDDILAMGAWDEDIKVIEHEEFFVRFNKHGFQAAYCPEVLVDHWRDRPWRYKKYRHRWDQDIGMRKHGFTKYTEMNGNVTYYDVDEENRDEIDNIKKQAA